MLKYGPRRSVVVQNSIGVDDVETAHCNRQPIRSAIMKFLFRIEGKRCGISTGARVRLTPVQTETPRAIVAVCSHAAADSTDAHPKMIETQKRRIHGAYSDSGLLD